MRGVLLALTVLAVAACKGQGGAAEERYAIVEASNASPAEKCRAAREVADGYLQDQSAKDYEHWTLIANSKCGLVN